MCLPLRPEEISCGKKRQNPKENLIANIKKIPLGPGTTSLDAGPLLLLVTSPSLGHSWAVSAFNDATLGVFRLKARPLKDLRQLGTEGRRYWPPVVVADGIDRLARRSSDNSASVRQHGPVVSTHDNHHPSRRDSTQPQKQYDEYISSTANRDLGIGSESE